MELEDSKTFLSQLISDIYPDSLWRKFYLEQLASFFSANNPSYQFQEIKHFADNKPGKRAFLSVYFDKRLSKEKQIGFIGNVEGEDRITLRNLIGQSEKWFKDQGVKKIIGPVSLSIWHRYRFFIRGREPCFLEPSNLKWYPQVFRQAGYKKSESFVSGRRQNAESVLKTVRPSLQEASSRGFKTKIFVQQEIKDILNDLHKISLAIFQRNDFSVLISYPEFESIYLPMISSKDFKIYLYTLIKQEKIIGYVFCVEDPIRPGLLLIKTIALLPEYRGQHLGAALIAFSHENALTRGLKTFEYLLIRTGNIITKMSYPGVKAIRRFVTFSKKI